MASSILLVIRNQIDFEYGKVKAMPMKSENVMLHDVAKYSNTMFQFCTKEDIMCLDDTVEDYDKADDDDAND